MGMRFSICICSADSLEGWQHSMPWKCRVKLYAWLELNKKFLPLGEVRSKCHCLAFFNLLTETTVNCRCPLQSLNWGYCKEKNAKSLDLSRIYLGALPLLSPALRPVSVCFCGNRQEDRWQTGGEECRQLNTWRDLVLARCLYPAAMPEMSLLKSGTAQTGGSSTRGPFFCNSSIWTAKS